ncbi:MAG: competence/damage-inducible protein A [Planctomycetota bacterium]|nr:competence/damage-inducible protein A [Planctomycetota bacterium]
MDAEILSIGEELLLGETVDTNSAWIARQLAGAGIRARRFQTVGDELAEIVAAFRLAISRSGLIVATGGLGPTEDDLTREGLCEACGGIGMEFHPEVLQWMSDRVGRPVESLAECNRRQAMVPRGAAMFRNEWGTAPGIYLERDGRHIFLLPGVPREMRGLFEKYVLPIVREKLVPRDERIIVRELHCFGIPESDLNQRIREYMRRGANPDVGTRVAQGVCSVRLVARGRTERDALGVLEPVERRIRELLGEYIFGQDGDTLASVCARVLLSKGLTAAIAESCTGGLLCGALTAIPGISRSFLEGAVVYSNEAKTLRAGVPAALIAERGAVSAEVAAALAEGIRKGLGADIGLSVTGIAGPAGGTPRKPIGLVYFGCSSRLGTETLQRKFPGERDLVRERSVQTALDILRRTAMRL